MRLATTIEAILYLQAKPVAIADLVSISGQERPLVEDALMELMEDYAHRDSALEIVETNQGYSLQLRAAFQHLIQDFVPADLSTASLRTLAAIAIKSPLLQTELIELRGSGAYQQVQELVEAGFVRKRKQTEGRSYWLEITDKFHQYFEIDRLPADFAKKKPK
ncbi:SMC-Scp complex subunit ScpB [Synechocystis salina LEGE 06099]|uniref:SMC-Scp complex subunit ScpB n=1 Tax=Synechocystis salina TaxID=945780 RepID=UPI00187E96B6|nr:SMC-Scp complex subunit ScpB [Synechocystis salina]MBE9203131.1 SMC-Scp complex subunit ScpB [Synechocystis salina LEGE 06099]